MRIALSQHRALATGYLRIFARATFGCRFGFTPTRVCALAVRAWILVLVFLMGCSAGWGADNGGPSFALERYTLKDGFSSNHVRRLLLDSRGFLWVGTADGLTRFDGHHARVYSYRPSDQFPLPGNFIMALAEDGQGNILVGTTNGLDRLQVSLGKFEKILVSEAADQQAAPTVNALHVDAEGTIWAGVAGQGLVQVDAAGKMRNRYAHDADDPHSLAQNHILCIKPSPDGRLLLGLGGRGLSIFDRQTGKFENHRFGSTSDDTTFRANVIRDILVDAQGHLWLASYRGLHRFEPQMRTREYFTAESTAGGLTENSLHRLIACPGGGFLLATYGGGLVHLNPVQRAFTKLRNALREPLRADAFFDLCVWNNLVWAASSTLGLLKLTFAPAYVKPISASSLGLPEEVAEITAFASGQEGHLWVAREGLGLFRYSLRQGNFAPKEASDDHFGKALAKVHITHLRFDLRGTLWMATRRQGLFSLDTASGAVRHFDFGTSDQHLPHMAVNALAVDQVGDVWIGTAYGLSRWETAAQRMHTYFVRKTETFVPQSSIISAVHADEAGQVFILTEKELLVYRNGAFEAVNPPDAKGHVWEALSMAAGGAHTHWVGTRTGLLRMVLRPGGRPQFTTFWHVPNLARLVVNGVAMGEHGFLWLSTQLGLFSFEPETETLRYHPVGLPGESPGISRISPYLAGIGHLFHSAHGWMAFDPEGALSSEHLLPALIDEVQIQTPHGGDRPWAQEPEAPTLRLPYGQHVLAFQFVASNHVTPGEITFQYRLPGLSPTWTDLGQQPRLALVGLSPGRYELQMRAFSLGSTPSGVSHFPFQIEAPIWQRWWFILLAILAFMATLWVVYKYDLQRKLELERLRSGIARDLHDEVGTTLTKISLFAELGLAYKDTPQGYGYVHKISELGRSAVEALGTIVWATDTRNDTMGNLFNRIQEQALDLLAAREIVLAFDQDNIPDQLSVAAHVRQHLYLICKEAIHNVAKHSGGNRLSVHFRKAGKVLSLTIADNGEVLPEMLINHQGNGLANIRARVAALGGKVHFGTAEGFCIAITDINLSHAKANIDPGRR